MILHTAHKTDERKLEPTHLSSRSGDPEWKAEGSEKENQAGLWRKHIPGKEKEQRL